MRARAANPHFDRIGHLHHVRRATEVAILVGALMFLGFLSAHSPRPPLPNWGVGENCVYFGRAGGHCAASAATGSERPGVEEKCLSLGRAGRYCLPETR